MTDYAVSTYGDRIAEIYDQRYAFADETSEAAATLADLAGNGPVLELGIGTGRLAIPIAARGLHVHGIDASAAMLDKLRGKPGAEPIGVTKGDFADVVATYMAALAVCAAAGPFAIFCWAGATATYAIALYEMDAVVDRCVANCGG